MKLASALLSLFTRPIVWWLVVLTCLLLYDAGAGGIVRLLAPSVLIALGGTFGMVAGGVVTRRDAEYLRALPRAHGQSAMPAWWIGFAIVTLIGAAFLFVLGSGTHVLLLERVNGWHLSFDEYEKHWPHAMRQLLLMQLAGSCGAYWCVIAIQLRVHKVNGAVRRFGPWFATGGSILVLIAGGFSVSGLTWSSYPSNDLGELRWLLAPPLLAALVGFGCYWSIRRQLAASGSDALAEARADEDTA